MSQLSWRCLEAYWSARSGGLNQICWPRQAKAIFAVLMDIQMPVMDGYEAAREIRLLDGNASRVPIVAMTANAFAEDRQKALESGMDGHIAKPIDQHELTETLAKFCERAR